MLKAIHIFAASLHKEVVKVKNGMSVSRGKQNHQVAVLFSIFTVRMNNESQRKACRQANKTQI